MLDEERGTYSPPTEDNLSYEARRRPSRDQAPLTLIISGIILVLVLMAAVIFYNSGLNGHGRAIPQVGDTLGDLKSAQVQDARPLTDQDLSDADTGGARFTSGAEAPADRSAAAANPGGQGEVNVAPPAATPVAGGLPSQSDNPALKAGASASSSALAQKPDPTPVPGTPTSTPAVTGGGTVVQIGAFTSQDIANTEYNRLVSSYGLFLSGTGKRIEKVETASGTFYRTSVTGFATPDKARAFCSALKAANHDCFVK